jgi:glutaredoxin
MFRQRRHDSIPVVLYSRPGCHLCDDALALLERISQRRPLAIDVVDITTDPELVRRYDIVIPVIRIGNEFELSAPIDEAAVRRAIREAAAGS